MSPHRKLCPLSSLLALREEARQAGKTVVHCHGCFDIVHPGHVQHLQFARAQGDLLVVSVSADSQVNKGADRPLIPDDLRAASLAALECVDAVYVNHHPTAVELLEQLRPDIYIKGREYEQSQDPRFLAERDAVVRAGGRVVFSSGQIVYSSTALIGSLDRAGFNTEKVSRFRQQYGLSDAHLGNLVCRFRDQRVVVVGDYILDRYHFCDASGVAAEGPMMSLRALQSTDYDGGAGVIALHLAALGAAPVLVTALADDEMSRRTELRLRSAGVQIQAIAQRRQLVAKHRYLVDQQKLLKVDDGAVAPLDSRAQQTVADHIIAAADGAAAVIFADFGYGLITAGLLGCVLAPLRRGVPVLTADASGQQANLLQFRDVDLLCPSERELRESLHDFTSGLGALAWQLLHQTNVKQALVALGRQGLLTFDWPDPSVTDQRLRSAYLPAIAAHAIDPLGCDDALLAVASLTLAVGGSLHAAAMLGALAASLEAQQIGNQALSADQLFHCLATAAQSVPAAA